MSNYEDGPSDKERAHGATIEEWRRKQMSWREQSDYAEKSLEEFLREGLGEIGSRSRGNIARQIMESSKNPHSPLNGMSDASGHLHKLREMDTEVITGMEPLPWNRRGR